MFGKENMLCNPLLLLLTQSPRVLLLVFTIIGKKKKSRFKNSNKKLINV
jgi:hypothetical protein